MAGIKLLQTRIGQVATTTKVEKIGTLLGNSTKDFI